MTLLKLCSTPNQVHDEESQVDGRQNEIMAKKNRKESPAAGLQRRPTYKVFFWGGRIPLDLGLRGPLAAKSVVRAPKVDPPGAPGRVFDPKCPSCGRDRRCNQLRSQRPPQPWRVWKRERHTAKHLVFDSPQTAKQMLVFHLRVLNTQPSRR